MIRATVLDEDALWIDEYEGSINCLEFSISHDYWMRYLVEAEPTRLRDVVLVCHTDRNIV